MRDLFIEIAFNLSLIGEFYLFIFGSDSSGFFSFFFGYSIVKFTFYNNVSTCFFFLVDFCLGFMGAILKLKFNGFYGGMMDFSIRYFVQFSIKFNIEKYFNFPS
jgi:hypothetical protein